MPRRTAFLYTDELLAYSLGDSHPLQQRRLQMVDRLLDAYGVFATVTRLAPEPIDETFLTRVHTAPYLDIVRRASNGERGINLGQYGLGPGDTPAFLGMWEAAKLYAGGSAQAAELVLSGQYEIAFNVAGGLHHAHPGKAYGFCVFNDLALAITRFLDAGYERVAYIDIDVHHGDGVQACHWDDPRVMTISLHESGRWLFPGTGFPKEIGGPNALGTKLNVPFAPYTDDFVWWEAFEQVVPEALRRFQPQALVLQLGADAHYADPLAHLQLTAATWLKAVETLLELGKDLPIVVTGGGGYNIRTVVRLWTQVTALCAGLTLPDALPEPLATQYDISHLSDKATPAIDDDTRRETHRYAQSQVQELRAALGWDT